MGSPLALRVLIATLAVAPLGLCLGAFLPLGVRTVAALSEHSREYVAWAWAVNGFCSVIASMLATLLAMSFGFKLVLLAAWCIYAGGVANLARVPSAPSAA
jgi:hypothetical protein